MSQIHPLPGDPPAWGALPGCLREGAWERVETPPAPLLAVTARVMPLH